MTANELITNLSNTSLVGQQISDLSIQENKDTLLELLNMAKNKVAEDTLLWLSGETITQVTGTQEYTLSTIPIQIIDIYDENQVLRKRNVPDYTGYYQTSPNKIRFNSIQNGLDIFINYYETPPDYLINDEIVIPPTLLSALQFYIVGKSFEQYKAEADIFTSAEYFKKYNSAIQSYLSKTDNSNADTIVSGENKIYKRGIV